MNMNLDGEAMKRFKQKLTIAISLVLALATSPALGDVVSNDYDAYGFRLPYTFNSSAKLSVEGSVFSGDSYKLVIAGTCPAGESPELAYVIDYGLRQVVPQASFVKSGASFRLETSDLNALVGGAEEKYAGIYYCSGLYSRFKTNTVGVFFEGPVGTPSNVQVSISGQTASFSWNAARGATSYKVVAQDPNFNCVTQSTSCSISGLPIGSYQEFTLISTDGMDNQTYGMHRDYYTLERVQIAPKISTSAAWASVIFQVGTALEVNLAIAGTLTRAEYFWHSCDRPVNSDLNTNLLPAGCVQIGTRSVYVSPKPGATYTVTYTPTINDVGKYIVGSIFGESTTTLTGAVLGNATSVQADPNQNKGPDPAPSDTKSTSTVKFTITATQKSLTIAQKALIAKFLKSKDDFTQISCQAKTLGVKKSTTELARIRALAKSSCAYANLVIPGMFSNFSASQGSSSGKAIRSIVLTGY